MFINQPNGGLMYIPDPSNSPSGPWTVNDTKVMIALVIIFFLISLVSVIAEWQFAKKKMTLKEYLLEVIQCGFSYGFKYEVSMFTSFMTLLFFIILGLGIIGFGVYGIYQML